MKRFISTILIGSFAISLAFGAYKKVPKNQMMKYRMDPVQVDEANSFHGSTPITVPATRNAGSFALVDSSTNGYGLVAQNTRPLFVDVDEGNWFTVYRQFAGENTTAGQIGAAFSDDDGESWDTYTNLNYNGNPPWGGGGVGGSGVAQGRYPSALGTEEQPLAVWNEYTGDTSTGSAYGGRPYYAYDSFGWDGGSFSYPADIDLLWTSDSKDLWSGSAAISYDDNEDMYVVNVVYDDWTRNTLYSFHSEAYDDGYVVFGEEQLIIDEVQDFVGGTDEGSFNTSPYISFNRDGQGIVGVVGFFVGADTETSTISQNHTGIFRVSDDHGASWTGCGNDVANGCATGVSGTEYVFIPDSVWDDLVATQFNYTLDNECEGTSHLLDSFYTYYEDDIKVDKDGNPHLVIQVLPCESTEEGSCWYTPEAGLYHFTADRDELGNADAWSWSFVMSGESTWSFDDMTVDTEIWNSSSSLSFSAESSDVMYIATNMATTGPISEDADLSDPCAIITKADYPEWSMDLYVVKSEDGGATWWNPYNASNTPDLSGGVCGDAIVGVDKCDPAELSVHSAQFGTDDETYVMYQMPNYGFNEYDALAYADFMNRVYIGTVVLDDSDIPEYGSLDTGSGCYADSGDVTGDGVVNVLDIVGTVNHVLGLALLTDTCAADYTGDGIVNVLDIVALVNQILGIGRVGVINNAESATLIAGDTFIDVESDGLVQGVQIELAHGSDFSIELSEEYISELHTADNSTTIIMVTDGQSSIEKVATIKGDYNITSSMAVNSEELIILNESQVNDFSVSNAYPNPFNPSTSINLDLNRDAFVSINIYNISGQLVDKVFSGSLNSSNHRFTWDASLVSSGVYFMNIQVDDQLETKKLMLVK